MDKNFDIYCACLLMFSASEHLYKHEQEFSNFLLEKTRELMGKIEINEKIISEVEEYAKQIKESITTGGIQHRPDSDTKKSTE
jgi:hypothetical protein